MKLTRYKIHKWLAICMGVFLLIWTVSGIVMLLPAASPDGLLPSSSEKPDYRSFHLSPAQAIEALEGETAHEFEISGVTLLVLRDRLLYRVGTRGDGTHLIDANSGEKIEITAEMARVIASDRVLPSAGEARVERLDEHRITYPWGHLPVYRVEFEKLKGTIAYVRPDSGGVSFTNLTLQIRTAIASLHTFVPLGLVIGGDRAHTLLLAAAVIALGVILTGYYVAFAPRR